MLFKFCGALRQLVDLEYKLRRFMGRLGLV